jgi:hypothetical protein
MPNYQIKPFLLGFAICVLGNVSSAFAVAQGPAPIATSAPSGETPRPNGGKSRIRFFGQNGVDLSFYRNRTCFQVGLFGLTGGDSVSGRIGVGFASLFSVVGNNSIGMPETNSTIHLRDKDFIGGKAFYREFEVTANEPLTVAATIVRCGPLAITFKPEANKDYEFEISGDDRFCEPVASILAGATSPATLQPLRDYVDASKCP